MTLLRGSKIDIKDVGDEMEFVAVDEGVVTNCAVKTDPLGHPLPRVGMVYKFIGSLPYREGALIIV